MRKLRDIMLGFVFLFCLAYECANMTWAGVAVRAVIIVAVTLVLMHSAMLEEKEREEKEERGVKTIYVDFEDGSRGTNVYEGSNIHQIKAIVAKMGGKPVLADVYTHVSNGMTHSARYRFHGNTAKKE